MLVVTSANLLALSTAPANAAPSPGPIHNAAYSQCIDAPGGALNVRLKLVECSGSGTQQWVFIPTGAANTYFIRNQASGFCMEVNNGTSTPGETVDEFTCNGLASEQWVLEGLTFRHAGTNQCLDTVSGPGSQLMQWTCGDAHPANVQSWITAPPPPQSEALKVTNVADRQMSVAWTYQRDSETGFLVRFRGKRTGFSDHTGTKTMTRADRSATLTGLFSGYEYTVSVVAFNTAGESRSSNEVKAQMPARTISVTSTGVGTSSVFAVTGSGFAPNSLIVVRATGQALEQVQFPATAGGDGKFTARQSIACQTGYQITFTAFEDAAPTGTFANAIVMGCP